ncbi:MAG: DUF3006 domain-containing protein [bacterium]|nr:DUF3006 domain-containing protein [bacterium]
MKFTAIVDRLEDRKYAVLEIAKKGSIVLPLDILPEGIAAGAALDITINRNRPYEKKRKSSITKLQGKLLRGDR